MELRIGISDSPREIDLDLKEDMSQTQLEEQIEAALKSGEGILWISDKKGKRVGVSVKKIAYVEMGPPKDERRVGFGAP